MEDTAIPFMRGLENGDSPRRFGKIMDSKIIFGRGGALPRGSCRSPTLEQCADKKFSLEQCGVDAVSVVAFAYDTYTNPSNDNGSLAERLRQYLIGFEL
jgi:hypothetical protein